MCSLFSLGNFMLVLVLSVLYHNSFTHSDLIYNYLSVSVLKIGCCETGTLNSQAEMLHAQSTCPRVLVLSGQKELISCQFNSMISARATSTNARLILEFISTVV